MKLKLILISMLAAAALIGCSKDVDTTGNETGNGDDKAAVAYVSLNVKTPFGKATRASSEEEASDAENKINKLYAILFDKNEKVIAYENEPPVQLLDISSDITGGGKYTSEKPKAFCVSSNAEGLLVVANPGEELVKLFEGANLNSIKEGMYFDAVNSAITNAKGVDEVANLTVGFTMINAGTDLASSDTDGKKTNAELCLIDIKDYIQLVGDDTSDPKQHATAEEAQKEAEKDANRVTVHIERLSSKIELTLKDPITVPADAEFNFIGWVLDAVNSKFFPYARKITTGTAPVAGSYYTSNFYTIDPNYVDNTGILYNKIIDLEPSTPGSVEGNATALTWLGDKAEAYAMENTMKKIEQRFKNATRIVLKGTYYPDNTWSGDWFSYAGTHYKDFAALKEAYDKPENVNLQNACSKWYAKVKSKYSTGLPDSFKDLTQANYNAITANIQNGGELVKEDGSVRWYQGGLNYYWYEIRHDDAITANMAFAKYGMVRNNWYSLTLNSVSNPGTPWYPSVDPEGGEKDPDPEDPIDEMEGYLGITVEVLPWVKWNHGIDL